MELLYNPDAMSEQEIKATFVARQPLVDELIALIERQPDGAGVQHVIIVAPRGMGKTTALLMIKFAIKDRGLADRWHALKFPEESYGINDLADFWLTVLGLLASETRDETLRQQAEDLKRTYPKNEDLQEVTLAALKDWRRTHDKRLLLLVENFDQILGQINDERDNARLRDVLMNDGTLMIIGGATTFFKEARAYNQPLYNFFKLYDLTGLQFDHIQDLLRRHATVDGVENFEDTLRSNASRLRTLAYFTGGNPRLVLMLYRIVTQSDLNEIQRGLEKLLDDVTPYYKAKIEILPPQQQKILDHIARVSGVTNEGLTPGEIATAVRLSPNQVSAQLKRLSEIGYVRAANLRGRNVYYTLSEPLFAIWYQMRLARDVHHWMGWLVNFLYHWYDDRERRQEAERSMLTGRAVLATTKVFACYQQALKLDPQHEFASNNRADVLHNVEDSFLDAIDHAHFEEARTTWKVLREAVDVEADKTRIKRGVLFAAELGHFAFASELLAEAGLREEFFPLDRALEYLQSKDEALIEKLSPEIKDAVRLVVNDLRPFLQPAEKSREHPLARAKLWLDDDYIAKRGGLVHKLKAKDSTGRWAYYFILVWKPTEQAFLNALKSGESIDLEDYGRVLASNYGEGPNEEVRALLKKKYGFEV
jgi:DNA-binding transcriptional ArsR family regulator